MKDKAKRTLFIKKTAYELGFFFCGISKSQVLKDEAKYLESWLNKKKNGEMLWLEKNFDLRINPEKLHPGTKSIISLGLNYFPKKLQKKNSYKISKYAYGKDYHFVIKDKLKKLLEVINKEIGDVEGRAFVDSAPIMDKIWAKKSGLGWQGKNTMIINKKLGSFFFLAELLINIELNYDNKIKDYCGNCTRCIDNCPTDALSKPYQIDANKCISYFTIEYKKELPKEMKGKFENWMFGCDICQDICPWNRLSKPNNELEFEPKKELLNTNNKEWTEITEEVFKQIFKKSAIKRAKYEGLKRNINFLK